MFMGLGSMKNFENFGFRISFIKNFKFNYLFWNSIVRDSS